MEKALGVDKRKGSRKAKAKKTTSKSIKVVYISNPRKVEVKASGFRALVQQLTGRDADVSYPTEFEEIRDVGGHQTAHDVSNDELELDVLPVDHGGEPSRMSDAAVEQLDDVFTPQLLENFTGLLQSTLWVLNAVCRHFLSPLRKCSIVG